MLHYLITRNNYTHKILNVKYSILTTYTGKYKKKKHLKNYFLIDFMYTNTKIKVLTWFFLAIFAIFSLMPEVFAGTKIVYPLKEISKLECRFQKFSDLWSNCKQDLPILNTKDYKKYGTQNGGYNDYTRIYKVLWGSSYKYGWDVWYGWHQWTDIATAQWTPVYSIADGTVIVSKHDAAWWKVVSVKHTINGKTIVSDYAHLHKIDVKNWTKVKAGQKIGEVWSTGNSTGNHLHFQIDFESKFYPYYYDYKACPYSYYQITENGVCFDELEKHTIDPMLFLETNGAALDAVKITTTKVNTSSNSSVTQSVTRKQDSSDHYESIFDTTVHVGYNTRDIQEVQMIFTDLREYKGPISGDYTDIEQDIIDYQIVNKLIKDKNDYGAGWFGPKTRQQVKNDYENFLDNGGKRKVEIADTWKDAGTTTATATVTTTKKTEKISRENILSREEIEAREVAEFMKDYNLDLRFADSSWRVSIGETKILKLTITNSRWRPFKWNLPGNITFEVDESKVKVFPNKFYYFSDGKRDIQLTGLKQGTTTLKVKFGASTLKEIFINVTGKNDKIEAKTGTIISHTASVIWEEKSGVILFKDAYGQKLIKTPYQWSFTLKAKGEAEVCIKRGSLEEIKSVFRRGCNDSEYQKEITFSYDDTVAGLVLYSYKVYDDTAKIEVSKSGSNSAISYKNIKTTAPKGLATSHEYYDEVLSTLEKGIVSDVNQGYFLQDRAISSRDANAWIQGTLWYLQDQTVNPEMKTRISQNLQTLQSESAGSEYITRQDFLDKAYKYLVLNLDANPELSIDYRDLDDEENRKANIFFDSWNTWKDQFWENYYRPWVQITRWEAAYLLIRTIEKNKEVFLTLR